MTRAQDAVLQAAAYIEAHADERITLGDLAARVGLSSSHLQREFASAHGRSPTDSRRRSLARCRSPRRMRISMQS